jgi:hypothetical protein
MHEKCFLRRWVSALDDVDWSYNVNSMDLERPEFGYWILRIARRPGGNVNHFQ